MTGRTTLQDDLRAIAAPDEGLVHAPCCGKSMQTWTLVKLTEDEATALGVEYACGTCLAGPPVETVQALTVDDPWGDNEIANGARAARALKLRVCDWTQVTDTALTEAVRTEWAVYRQALRDVTETYETPDSVVWPEPPTAET